MRNSLLLALLFSFSLLFAAPADSLSVGLVTCFPGEDVYQLEGHTAIHIKGSYRGEPVDVAVNYGLFDFNSPNFVYRFVKGETDYWCGMTEWSRFVAPYIRQGRRVVEHPIILDSIQTQRLVSLINENLLPANSVYRYNYVKDNCATRPLRIIERAIGDSIILPEPYGPCRDDRSFRQIMERHHLNYPWYQFGIDLALGSGIDYDLTPREKSFAPTVLFQQLDSAYVGGRKLTAEPVIINPGIGNAILGPTPWYATPLAAGWALFAIALALTVYDVRRRKVSRWFDSLLFALFGVAGLVLTFLIFVSVHEATSPNMLYLWLNPLCFVVPVFIWLKKCKNVVFSYQIINFALILIMILALTITRQSINYAFIPLVGCDLLRSISYIYVYKSDRYKLKNKR